MATRRSGAWIFVLAVFLFLAGQVVTVHAAIVYSGDLDPADPDDWDSSTDAYIGNSGPGEVEINSGSDLLSYCGFLGYESDTSGTMTVTGSGSTWTNSCHLHVGYSGSGALSIAYGGAVSNDAGFIGSHYDSIGAVSVDGAGSIWTNNYDLHIGHGGNGTLSITNGGTVNNDDGYVGHTSVYSDPTGAVTVEGTNSTWNNSDDLYVGYAESGSLDITSGGTVNNTTGYIGRYTGSTGVVTVDGTNATWNNTDDLYVGYEGEDGSGTLNIANGGAVNVIDKTYIAHADGSTGSLDFGTGGGTLTTKSLYVLPSQLFGTGTINTNGIVNDHNLVFDSSHGLVQTLTIGGSGQDRNVTVNLNMAGAVGDLGVNNGSIVINGIAVNSQAGYVGYASGSTGTANVDNAGSWTNTEDLFVGNQGNGSLTITGGGTVSNVDGYIGRHSGSASTVTVNGTGSTWTNSDDLFVGYEGNGTLNIINNGAVNNDDGYIGYSASSVSTATVSSNSTWTNLFDLSVGHNGNGTLAINSGGDVSNRTSYIGYNSGSTGAATVDGTGSTWTNSVNLYVGSRDNGTLAITNGGAVTNNNTRIGNISGSTGAVTVDGTNSTLINNDDLFIGNSGSGTLTITGSGTVNNDSGYIGRYTGSTGTVTVDGTNSTWNNTDDLYVGYDGNGTLNIINSGAVNVTDETCVAYGAGSGSIDFGTSGGTLTTKSLYVASSHLAGTGTINTNGIVSDYDLVFDSAHGLAQTLTIGGSGQPRNVTVNLNMNGSVGCLGVNHGSMTINGITVNSQAGYVGYYSGSIGVATVGGTGSSWANTDDIYVGYKGTGTLNINDNGVISNHHGYIGYAFGSTGIVIVDGAHAIWTNNNDLLVGYNGSGTLNITGGGVVSNFDDGFIGYASGSTGFVAVDGDGSTWINNDNLYVGRYGSGMLNIKNNGLVSVAGTLTTEVFEEGSGCINMSADGMLALAGEADGSIIEFFDLISGTDAVRWWDPDIADWNSLTTATVGEDYMLEYINDGSALDGYTLLTVMAIKPGPGDANCDGQVDGSDATILANYWQHGVGMTSPDATWAMGDFNGDHVVDGSDATLLASHWQEGTPPSSAVPEPGCVALLLTLLAAAGIFCRFVPALKKR